VIYCRSTYLVRIVTYKKLICVGHIAMEGEVKEEHGVLWSATWNTKKESQWIFIKMWGAKSVELVIDERPIVVSTKVIKINPCTDLDRPWGFQEFEAPRFMTIGTRRWEVCQPHAPAAFTPKSYSWYLFLLGPSYLEELSWGFRKRSNCPVNGYLCPQRPCWGTGGSSFARIFGEKKKHIWVPFLDPEDIKILRLGGHLEL